MVTLISHSPAETEALGQSWASTFSQGQLIGLIGELGAGKTQLVKGLARGLGVTERIHSPTFALINQYWSGRLPLFHLDLYRLETPQAVLTAGLVEYLTDSPGITVVEWIEHWLGTVPSKGSDELPGNPSDGPLRLVWIDTRSEAEREIAYEDFGD